MNRNFFKSSDAILATGSKHFSALINATPNAFGLSPQQAMAYATLDAAYQTAYAAAVDPGTRGMRTVAGKRSARRALVKLAGDYAAIIRHTAGITDQQLIDLGLSVHKKNAPKPVPTLSPLVLIRSVNANQVNIEILNPLNGNRAKPPGVAAIVLFSHLGSTPPGHQTQMRFEGLATRSKVEVEFPANTEPFAQVWISATYVNQRGKAGPGSSPVTTNLGTWAVQRVEADLPTGASTVATQRAA